MLPHSPSLLKKLLWTLFVLNLFDAVCTAIFTTYYGAVELNPLMAFLLDRGVAVFLIGKMGLITGLSLILWKNRQHSWTSAGSAISVAIYSLLAVFHIYVIYRIFTQ